MNLSFIEDRQKQAADKIAEAKRTLCEAQKMSRAADKAMKIYFKNGVRLLKEKGYLRTAQPDAKRNIYGLLSNTNNGYGLCVSYTHNKEICFFNYDRSNWFSIKLGDPNPHTCNQSGRIIPLDPADPDYKIIQAATKIFEEAN